MERRGRGRSKGRVDHLLVSRGLAPSGARARALVLAGRVTSDGHPVSKPGTLLPVDAPLEVTRPPRFVSRGGEKLAGAIESFGLRVAGQDALDVGASTGGFTHALLEAGAERVIALDVGRGQLDWTLRNLPRVFVLEGINARYLRVEMLPFRPGLAVIDVSFISLERVLPAIADCLVPGGEIVALVKPQFEIGRGRVGRGGIVRDPELHLEVLRRVTGFARRHGLGVAGVARSCLRGAEGNVEFFLRLIPGTHGISPPALAAVLRDSVEPPNR